MNSTTATTSFSRSSQMLDTSPSSDVVSLRNFVVDEDRANLGSDLWKSVDKSAFILAQRDAIEAFNFARAMRLSEESAAKEELKRLAQAEGAARSLAKSWNVDGLQSALLKNTSGSSSSSPPRPSTTRQPSSSPPPISSPSSRPVMKRDPSTADNSSNTLTSASSPKVSSPSSPPAAVESSSQQKRRKVSISSSQPQIQPHYSYSTSNYSYHYPSHNQTNSTGTGTSQASVHAQQQFEGRKHPSSSSFSASSRDIQAGQILNPKESSPRTQSPSSSASAQAAAAEREKEREKGKGKERSRSNSNSNSSSSSRKRSSSAAQQVHAPQPQVQAQVPPQTQSQHQPHAQTQQHQHVPRDIFSPVRFNCAKCGTSISSVVLSQPSLPLTSPDPFAHPFASALHVICSNASCGAVHCRGCLQVVKCRDVEHPSSSSADSQALVLISSSPASNPTSPTRLAFSSSKSHQHTQTQAQGQRACAGGPGCALWSCCPTVRVLAVWEALRAFDALFGAEAGFQTSNQQQWRAGQAQGDVTGRQYREAYIKMVISSKADKNMKKFEDGFVRVLKVVASWLQFPAEPPSAHGERQSMILGSDDGSQSPNTFVLLHLARLFLSSHLLEVVHTFLGNRNVKDWMTHAETYLDVLDVVGKMMDCGLGFLLKEVSGVQAGSTPSPPASGFYNPFAAVPTSTPSSLAPSPSQSPPPLAPLALSSTSAGLSPSPPTLYDLVSQLETYRGELKKLLTKVSFGVTVDKASKLHEAIAYLVLQLVVGEF